MLGRIFSLEPNYFNLLNFNIVQQTEGKSLANS